MADNKLTSVEKAKIEREAALIRLEEMMVNRGWDRTSVRMAGTTIVIKPRPKEST